MSLESIGKRLLNLNLWLMLLTAVVSYFVSRYAGQWLDGRFPAARYVPPLLLMVAGGFFGRKSESHGGYGYAITLGAGVDLGVAAVERSGLLAQLGVK